MRRWRLRGRVLAIVAGCALVALGVGLFLAPRPSAERTLAERARDCVLRADATCARAVVSPIELSSVGMSDSDFQRFFEKWIPPRYQGEVLPDSLESVRESKGLQTYLWTISVTKRGVRGLPIVVDTSSGTPNVANLISELVLADAARSPEGGSSTGAAKYRRIAEYLRKNQTFLESFGIRRLAAEDGTSLTLPELSKWAEERARVPSARRTSP